MNKTVVFVLVGIVSLYVGLNRPQSRLLVLLKGRGGDLSSDDLKHLGVGAQLESIFEVHGALEQEKTKEKRSWDYVVLTSDFKEKENALQYANKVANLPFVEEIKSFSVVSRPLISKLINGYLAVKKALYATLDWLPARPLEAGDEIGFEDDDLDRYCSDVSLAKEANRNEDILVVNVNRVAKPEVMELYSNRVIHEIFPVIGTRLEYFGGVQSDYWTSAAIVRYRDRASFCELAQSRLLREVYHYKKEAIEDGYTLMTTKLNL